VDELLEKILEYIAFYILSAKPMKWTYDETPKNNAKITKVI